MLTVVVTVQVQLLIPESTATHLIPYLLAFLWTVTRSPIGAKVLAVLYRGLLYLSLNLNINSILWGNSPGCAQVANVFRNY